MRRVSKQTRREAILICPAVAMTMAFCSRYQAGRNLGFDPPNNRDSSELAYLAVQARANARNLSGIFVVSGVDRRILHAEAAQNLANGWKPGSDWC